MLLTKSYESENVFFIFEKSGNLPQKSQNLIENRFIRFSLSENRIVDVPIFCLQKWEMLYFLPEERSRMHVY